MPRPSFAKTPWRERRGGGEMKRYGLLAESFDPATGAIDVYQTDRAYWQSLWYRPPR